jgi:RND family efflux transporter MFP subunit
MKSSLYLLLLSMVLLAACGEPTNEEKIAAIEAKIRAQEEKIRASKAAISDFRAELIKLGVDTLVARDTTSVTVLPVERAEYTEYVEVSAAVSSRENLLISSDMGGRIMQLRVREGQRVGRGQVLAELDGEIIRKQIAELENALSLAKTVFEKRKKLWDQRIGSEVEYLQAENNVQSLEKSLATANAQLEKAFVRSPISGTVDKVMLNTGELAGPGQPILRVVNLDRVQIKADVSEAYVGRIAVGDQVMLRFPSIGLEQQASVSAVGQVIDPNNRTFTLEVDLPNQQGALKPNLVGSISLRTFSAPDQVLVPSRLVQSGYNGSFVYVVDSVARIAVKRDIELGNSSNGKSIVKTGLAGGEWLVDDGFRTVSDSAYVRIRKQ